MECRRLTEESVIMLNHLQFLETTMLIELNGLFVGGMNVKLSISQKNGQDMYKSIDIF